MQSILSRRSQRRDYPRLGFPLARQPSHHHQQITGVVVVYDMGNIGDVYAMVPMTLRKRDCEM